MDELGAGLDRPSRGAFGLNEPGVEEQIEASERRRSSRQIIGHVTTRRHIGYAAAARSTLTHCPHIPIDHTPTQPNTGVLATKRNKNDGGAADLMQQQPGSGRGRQRPAGGGAEAAMPPYHHYYGSMEDDDKADGDWKQRGARAGGQLPNPQPPPPQQQQVGRRQRRKRGSSSWDRAEVVRGVLFGAINASICLPASVSFATIIFRHEAFGAWVL